MRPWPRAASSIWRRRFSTRWTPLFRAELGRLLPAERDKHLALGETMFAGRLGSLSSIVEAMGEHACQTRTGPLGATWRPATGDSHSASIRMRTLKNAHNVAAWGIQCEPPRLVHAGRAGGPSAYGLRAP